MSRARFLASITGEPVDAVSALVRKISRAHEVSPEAIMGPKRTSELVVARWNLWAELYSTGMAIKEIGRRCNRDHSTVLHGLRQWGAK